MAEGCQAEEHVIQVDAREAMEMPDQHVMIPKAEVICVEYPAIVQDAERALTTLGGQDQIGKTENSKTPYLQLFWNPSAPHCHAMVGQRHQNCRILIRISRPKDRPGGSVSAQIGCLKAQVAARVKSSYR